MILYGLDQSKWFLVNRLTECNEMTVILYDLAFVICTYFVFKFQEPIKKKVQK